MLHDDVKFWSNNKATSENPPKFRLLFKLDMIESWLVKN